jgi:epoxide hydrolase 4
VIRTREVRANGLRFRIDEAGEGDTVALCLHGFPEARQAWAPQLPALAALGWRAAAPDLRGYGDSDRPFGVEPYRLKHLAEDVAELFDALGARRRILIGHDWGGVIAWYVAVTRRVPLDGLVVLNAPHPAVFARELTRGWSQKRRSWYVAAFQLPWLPEAFLTRDGGKALEDVFRTRQRPFPPELLALYRRNVAGPGAATAMVNYYRANAASLGSERAAAVPPVEAPTLLIWGEEDVALDIRLTEGVDAHVHDLTLRRLPGVSHWVQEDAPDAVNAAITEWARTKALA